MPDDQFAAVWNAAGTLAEAVEAVCERAGVRIPRWVVLARAVACRAAGADLRRFPDESRPAGQAGSPLARVRELARRLMAEHGLAAWEFGFNGNVRRAGVCRYRRGGRPGRIELSRHFVLRNPDDEVRDTILHEIAHALVGPDHGHDEAWRAKCLEVGARPERCYGEHVDMPKGRWRANCPSCRREYDRHRRPDRLSGWYCRACGKDRGPLRWQQAG